MLNIFWFRRDLRIEDNVALFHALQQEESVLPIFIFDKNIIDYLPKNDARVQFIHSLLSQINQKLAEFGHSLAIFHDTPINVFHQLLKENKIKAVFFNRDYEPSARARDKEIYELLMKHQIEVKSYKDQVIFEKNEVVKDDKTPYLVYTPYSKKWKSAFLKIKIETFDSASHLNKIAAHHYPFLTLNQIGFENSDQEVLNYEISNELVVNYESKRNFPSVSGTSNLSPHLRFGSVSIRQIALKAKNENHETFLNELIWREFFMMILWHFPQTVNYAFKPIYDQIEWRNNEEEFKKWCDGKTGYPIVDAAMTQLNQTGYMHNRCRMIVASFLCKHLLIDWRWGEAYFAKKLLDFEQSANVGNWQWAAGCGVDAAPYFRIFNPSEQQKKFDPEYKYIKKWIQGFNPSQYIKPIVEHTFARKRCLEVYQKAVKS